MEVEHELLSAFVARFGAPFEGREWFRGSHRDVLLVSVLERFVEKHVALVSEHGGGSVVRRYYEWLDVMPDEWLRDRAVVDHVLIDRDVAVDERSLLHSLSRRLSSADKRVKLATVCKQLPLDAVSRYQDWRSRWSGQTPTSARRGARVVYRHGVITKVSDINAAIPRTTSTKLLALDRRFKAVRIITCTHCKKHHLVGCCNKYDKAARTTTLFILHCELI